MSGLGATGFEATDFNTPSFETTGFDSTGFDSTGFDSTGFGSTGFDSMGFGSTGSDASSFLVGGAVKAFSPLSVTSTTPGSGKVDAQGLKQFTVTFDRPLDPFSLGLDDFRLVREGDAIGLAPSLTESLDASDPTNQRIVLTLDKALPAGEYRLVMSGWSFLAGADGASLGWGGDQVLSSFDVVESGPNLTGAIDLGTPNATPTIRPGYLDVAANPYATDVFKVTLPQGQSWGLRLDVSAQADGGTLDTVVTLYDAKGNRVASADQGGIDAPLDPHLFIGVPGGTYYIVVSGSQTGDRPDGAYRLQVAANPIDSSISVTGIQLDRANALSVTPTGVTIRFSGPVDAVALGRDKSQVGDASHALVLIDAEGRTWPLIVSGVSPDRTSVSFAFRRELPAGTYRIQIGNSAILVSLAGQAPVATDQAPGVLGTITVAEKAASDPSDLGTLWPGDDSTVSTTLTLAPGESQVRMFTLIDHGKASLTITGDVGRLRFTLVNSDGTPITGVMETSLSEFASGSGRWTYTLPAGTYSLILTNTDDTELPLALTVKTVTASAASLLDNGIGQTTATTIQLVAPSVPANDPASLKAESPIDINPTSPAGPFATVYAPAIATANADASTSGGPARSGPVSVPGLTSGSMILVGGNPAGQPSSSFEMISVVGPTSGTGTLALSSSQPGLPNGLLVINQSRPSGPRRSSNDFRANGNIDGRARGGEEAIPEAVSAPSITDASDDRALVEAGWLDRAIAWATGQSQGKDLPAQDPEVLVAAPEAPLTEDMEQEPRIEFASMTSPAVIIATIVMAYRKCRARRSGNLAPAGGRTREEAGGSRRRFAPGCKTGVRP